MASPVLVQTDFQGRDDDVALNSATFTHSLNGDWTQDTDTKFRIRFAVSETNGRNANLQYTLYYSYNGGGYNPVTTSSNEVSLVSSDQSITDGDTTTAVISSSTGFVTGYFDDNASVSSILLNSTHTEMEYCMVINSANVTDGYTIVFEVYGSASPLTTYTNEPTVTINIPPQSTSDNQPAYFLASESASDNTPGFFTTVGGASDNQPGFFTATVPWLIPLWQTGFEYGTLTANGLGLFDAVDSGAVVQSTVVHTGNYALKTGGTSVLTSTAEKDLTDQVQIVRFYFRADSSNTITGSFFVFGSLGGINYQYFDYLPSTNQIRVTSSEGTQYHSGTFYTDTWYRVDINFDAVNGHINYQIDGVAGPQHNFTPGTVDAILFKAGYSSGETSIHYFDDVIITTDADDYPIGEGYIKGIRPNGAGTSNPSTVIQDQTSTVINDSTNPANVELDKLDMYDGSTYIKQTGDGNYYAEVTFDQLIDQNEVQSVFGVLAYAADTAVPANDGDTRIVLSDDTYTSIYDGDMSDSGDIYYKSSGITAPLPSGWTLGEVNTITGQVGYSTSSSNNPRWIALLAEVAFAGVEQELLYDQFYELSTTLLENHAISPENEFGSNWSDQIGTWQILGTVETVHTISNAIYSHSVVTTELSDAVISYTTESDGTSDPNGAGNYAGIVARWSATDTYWLIGINQTEDKFRIYEINGGTPTVRASADVTIDPATSYQIDVSLDGQTITATLDGGNLISYSSATLNETSVVHGIQSRMASEGGTKFKVRGKLKGFLSNQTGFFTVEDTNSDTQPGFFTSVEVASDTQPGFFRTILVIDHETNDLSQYTSTTDPDADLSVTAGAALGGTNYGLSCIVDDTTAFYGSYDLTSASTSGIIRVRFRLDTNNISMNDPSSVWLFVPYSSTGRAGGSIGELEFGYYTSSYVVRANIIDDTPANNNTARVNITDGEHWIEAQWTRASSGVASDGHLEWWVDGKEQTGVTGIDNFDRFSDFDGLEFGQSYTASTVSGTFYLDELVVNDSGDPIGPFANTLPGFFTTTEGGGSTSSNQSAYFLTEDSTSDNTSGYFLAKDSALDNTTGYFKAENSSLDNVPGYFIASNTSSDNTPGYFLAEDSFLDNQPGYFKSDDSSLNNQNGYFLSESSTFNNQPGYFTSVILVVDNLAGFFTTTAQSANGNLTGYFESNDTSTDTQPAYFLAKESTLSNLPAFFGAEAESTSNLTAYFLSQDTASDNQPAYFISQDSTLDNQTGYFLASEDSVNNLAGFFTTTAQTALSNLTAFFTTIGVLSDNQPGYFISKDSLSDNQTAYFISNDSLSDHQAGYFNTTAQIANSNLAGFFTTIGILSGNQNGYFRIENTDSSNLPGYFNSLAGSLNNLSAYFKSESSLLNNQTGYFKSEESILNNLTGFFLAIAGLSGNQTGYFKGQNTDLGSQSGYFNTSNPEVTNSLSGYFSAYSETKIPVMMNQYRQRWR